MSKYYIPPAMRSKLTVEEVAKLLLEVLQVNDSGRSVRYSKNQLPSIRRFEFMADGEPLEKDFERTFAQAKQSLLTRGLIFKDPTQSSDDFVLLTESGRDADTEQLIIGLMEPSRFVERVEAKSGTLDATCKQYLIEAYKASTHDMWLTTAFMLGGAAERLIILLSRHMDLLLKDAASTVELEKLSSIRKIKEWCVDQLQPLRKKYPESAKCFGDVEDKLTALYALYRYERNDAGHPSDAPYQPDIDSLRPMLQGFGTLAAAITDILKIAPLHR